MILPALEPVVLEAESTRLEPLSPSHKSDVARVALDPGLWRWTPTQIHTDDDLDAYIATAMAEKKKGTCLPFAVIERSTGRAIGSTRFGNVDPQNRRVEIGWSWLGADFQRKAFNTEAKLVMLAHAFERMNSIRVELRADRLNVKSRKAIARLGAKEEGTLRSHMILPTGRRIDWVYYSILREEWPAVEARLREKLASYVR